MGIDIAIRAAADILAQGRWGPRAWYALAGGGGKWALAHLAGDIAGRQAQRQRVRTCMACPSVESVGRPDGARTCVRRIYYCGKPGEETADTCGCLLAAQVRLRIVPAGKTTVGSARCTQGKW